MTVDFMKTKRFWLLSAAALMLATWLGKTATSWSSSSDLPDGDRLFIPIEDSDSSREAVAELTDEEKQKVRNEIRRQSRDLDEEWEFIDMLDLHK
jgi:hypothetical protein